MPAFSSITVRCQHCGTAFLAQPNRLKRNRCKYCSRQCEGLAKTKNIVGFFWSCVQRTEQCWEWSGGQRRGYGYFEYIGRKIAAHRLSYELHYGPIPEGQCVLHRCDNPPCVRPDHLFLVTVGDNNRDRHRKGRTSYHRAKLTENEVRAIRNDYTGQPGEKARLAKRFSVTKTTIGYIISRKIWTNI